MTEAPVKPTVDANMIALLRDRRFTMTGGSEFALEIVAALSRPPAAGQEPAIPPGYVLVPLEATEEMLTEGFQAGDFHIMYYDGIDKPGTPRYSLAKSWRAMLAAAALPQGNAPAGGTTQGEQQ